MFLHLLPSPSKLLLLEYVIKHVSLHACRFFADFFYNLILLNQVEKRSWRDLVCVGSDQSAHVPARRMPGVLAYVQRAHGAGVRHARDAGVRRRWHWRNSWRRRRRRRWRHVRRERHILRRHGARSEVLLQLQHEPGLRRSAEGGDRQGEGHEVTRSSWTCAPEVPHHNGFWKCIKLQLISKEKDGWLIHNYIWHL